MTNLGDDLKKMVETIETERLFFRGITEEDAIEIVTWRSNPDVYIFFKRPHKITIDEHLNWYRKHYLHDRNRYDWMCIEKESGQKIGVFGLIYEGITAEVNYLLAPAAQHKGYAAEGIRGLIHFAEDVWGVRYIFAEIHKDNEPSISLVKKLGFSLQKTDDPFEVYVVEK